MRRVLGSDHCDYLERYRVPPISALPPWSSVESPHSCRSVSTDGTSNGQPVQVDASRARARRVACARAVVILAAIAGAALLILIVVGSLTSDMTDEIGQPNAGPIGRLVR